jgi:hypothetical protein
MSRRVLAVALCLGALASCRNPTPGSRTGAGAVTPPAATGPAETAAPSSASAPAAAPVDFAAVDRAARAVQRARKPGLSEKDFNTLLEPFRKALADAKSRPVAADDAARVDRYQQALDAYEFSLAVWQAKAQRQASRAGGDRPVVQIGTMTLDRLIAGATRYGLPITEEPMPDDPSVILKVLPADSRDRMWTKADALVSAASAAGSTKSPR